MATEIAAAQQSSLPPSPPNCDLEGSVEGTGPCRMWETLLFKGRKRANEWECGDGGGRMGGGAGDGLVAEKSEGVRGREECVGDVGEDGDEDEEGEGEDEEEWVGKKTRFWRHQYQGEMEGNEKGKTRSVAEIVAGWFGGG